MCYERGVNLQQDKGEVLKQNGWPHMAFQKEDNAFCWEKSKCSKGVESVRERKEERAACGKITTHGAHSTFRMLSGRLKQWEPVRSSERRSRRA